MKRRLRSPRILGLLFLPVPSLLAAQHDQWDRQVHRYLSQVTEHLQTDGYIADDRWGGTLNAAEADSFSVSLRPDIAYVLAGVCDADCSELQLAVYSETRYEVAVARSAGSAPMVRMTPRSAGRFTVQVVMARCAMNPCRYGVGLFRHP